MGSGKGESGNGRPDNSAGWNRHEANLSLLSARPHPSPKPRAPVLSAPFKGEVCCVEAPNENSVAELSPTFFHLPMEVPHREDKMDLNGERQSIAGGAVTEVKVKAKGRVK